MHIGIYTYGLSISKLLEFLPLGAVLFTLYKRVPIQRVHLNLIDDLLNLILSTIFNVSN